MADLVKDRRKSQRRRAERIKTEGGWTVSMDSIHKGDIGNLSVNGLFVKTDKELPVDSIITIDFKPPKRADRKVILKSKIVWSRKDREGNFVGMGIEFLKHTKKDEEIIAFYIDILKKERDERS